jgi:CheY-like chemotaxis protein
VHSETPTVLVVEDETLIRMNIVEALETAGFEVFEADHAERAIAILEAHSEIRLVFTDVDMPGTMDGLKLAAFVRDRWPPIKIIVTSGRVTSTTLPDGAPFLTKPYQVDQVLTAIRTLMIG